jgi:nucleoredoxin
MDSLLGHLLLTKNGLTDTNIILNKKKIIGLYFSGNYCPPCRLFTPILNKVYEKIKNDCEIIFISSDKTEDDFNKYYSKMSCGFIALPYHRRDLKIELCDKFNIKTIPALIFLDNKGNIININGRYLVQDNEDIISTDFILQSKFHN